MIATILLLLKIEMIRQDSSFLMEI